MAAPHWQAFGGWTYEPGRPETWPSDAQLADMIFLETIGDEIVKDAQRYDDEPDYAKAQFYDGSVTALKWSQERMREHLGIPPLWPEALARVRGRTAHAATANP